MQETSEGKRNRGESNCSKVLRQEVFGFAARCEAMASPRRKRPLNSLGYALTTNN